jgi:diguanylate cyclase (GGDEF)-like protein
MLLRGDEGDRRNRFWAERAGAVAFLGKGRIGELVRVLRHAIAAAPPRADFFLQLGAEIDIRDRIARHLDAALFESVVAAEVRALASCDTPMRLFDLLSQFLSQIHPYRWLALSLPGSEFLGIHRHSSAGVGPIDEVRALLQAPTTEPFVLDDEDAVNVAPACAPFSAHVELGGRVIGEVALAPARSGDSEVGTLVRILSRELGGPLRMVSLVEETRKLAATDPLTRLMNRRAFLGHAEQELARVDRFGGSISVGLLDVDHFKSVNDTYGHGAGDQVLAAIAEAVRGAVRRVDIVSRWGGEEIVLLLPGTALAGAEVVAERVRQAISGTPIAIGGDRRVTATASIGLAERLEGESADSLIARADIAMYRAKQAGRDRVELDGACTPPSTLRALGR